MDIQNVTIRFFINIFPIISVAYIIFGVKFYMHKWRNSTNYFSPFIFAAAFYSFGYFLEVNSINSETAFFVRNFEYLGVVLIPQFWILFVLELTKIYKVTKRLVVSLTLFSLILWSLYITDPFYHLFYKKIDFVVGDFGGTMLTIKGPAYYLLITYYIVLLVISSILLLKAYKMANKQNNKNSFLFLFISFQFPWLAVIYILAGFDTYIDVAPLTIMIMCALFTFNEFRNDMFELQISRWKSIFANLAEPTFLIDSDGEIICSNDGANSLFSQFKKSIKEMVKDLDMCDLQNKPVSFIVDDKITWFELKKNDFDTKNGLINYMLSNISIERNISLVIEGFFNQIEDFIFIGTEDGKVIFVNNEVKKRLGYSEEEIRQMHFLDFRPKELREQAEIIFSKLLKREEKYCNLPLQIKSGVNIPVETRIWLGDWGGKRVIYAMAKDITIRELAYEKIKISEEQFRLLVMQMQQGLAVHEIICDDEGLPIDYRFISVNRSYERITGLLGKDIIGKTVLEVLPNTEKYWIERYGKVALTGQPYQFDDFSAELDKYFSVSAYSPKENLFAVIVTDVTEKKKREAEVEFLSYHDQLTGIYNRRYFEYAMQKLDKQEYFPLTLVMADVNGLKLTNDAFGHQKGDVLLQRIANVLRSECRVDDVVARIGGDEFIILLPQTNDEDAKIIINRINTAISEQKFKNLVLSISIGYAVKNDCSEDINEIFKQAEDDMYRHKLSESSSMRSKTIDLIMNTLYEKNNREMLHSKRVSEVCEAIANKMDFAKDDVNQIRIAGLMHDIGKIGINEKILDKPHKLNNDEWDEIRRHSEIGYRILSSVNEFSEIADYVLEHHEKWDGSGYPKGLKGEEISLQSRIITIADAYDAMIAGRPYRSGLKDEEVIKEIKRCAGSQFDPFISRIFVEKVLGREW